MRVLHDPRARRELAAYVAALAALHVAAFLLLAIASGQQQALWGMGLLAYTLGLRHAFDADHIAAIDNTVRALVHRRRSSMGVGFFFSLGHSSVVVALILAVSLSVRAVRAHLPALGHLGGVIGGLVSSLFLLALTVVNLVVLFSLIRAAVRAHQHPEGEPTAGSSLDEILAGRGFVVRLVRPLFRLVSHSWHMYPIGLLFGLGFDTATEVAVIALSATTSAQASMPVWGVLAFPLLFTAGMMLMDTTDSVMMTGAYQWALSSPKRKIYYNLTVTSISVVAAFAIGGVGLLQLVGELVHGRGHFWAWAQGIDLGNTGVFLIVLFALIWVVAFWIWRVSVRKHSPISGGARLGS